ncbi:hypothetical protein GGX14DRAFT_573830 [Mycena pura]|uniref:Uncharacterized protein n=1 Tax=Mycena pura TaxID=153505 RepID=A0AAD6Y5P2_9AGAR|nr:hypothetical protein GGX14DRAFT_573830 [Mycena pura]
MTNQSRSRSQPALPEPLPMMPAASQPAFAPVLVFVPCSMAIAIVAAAGPGFPSTMITTPSAPAPAAPAPAEKTAASTAAAAAPARNPGAGLPEPLVQLLRDEKGPFLANEVFSITPTEPLAPIEEADLAPEWYAITRGRFVGVVDQYALSAVAISGVAHGARKAYTTQGLALSAFNQALTWGGVQVV